MLLYDLISWCSTVTRYIRPMYVIMDDLKAFGINADQLTTSAQDEEEWFKTAEQGAEGSMTK